MAHPCKVSIYSSHHQNTK